MHSILIWQFRPEVAVLIAPEEMLARALNGSPHLQQFRILFLVGIRSGILEHAGPRLPRCEEGLGLPSTLWTLLEENHRSILIVEHRAYKRAGDMAGHIAQAMKQALREASSFTPLYSTGTWKPWPRRTGSSASVEYAGAGLQPGRTHLGGDGKPDHLGSHEMAMAAPPGAQRKKPAADSSAGLIGAQGCRLFKCNALGGIRKLQLPSV